MKFVISLLLILLATPSWADPIHIYYENRPSRALLVKNIFMDTYQIPESLIDLREVKKCQELNGGGKLDLCLNNNGDLLVVSVDRRFISESLKIFQAP
jgi:hypothetical protein